MVFYVFVEHNQIKTYQENNLTSVVEESGLPVIENKMNILKRIGNWILWSSVNSEKISLTLKTGIPFLVLWGVSDTATLNQLVGTIGQLIVATGTIITGTITLFAFIRKVWFTMK